MKAIKFGVIEINRLDDITDKIELFTGIESDNEVFRPCKYCGKLLTINNFRKRIKKKAIVCNECLKEIKEKGLRKCSYCDNIYPYTKEYFTNSRDTCRVCERRMVSEWQKNNKEKINKRVAKYSKTEKGRENVRIRNKRHEFKKKQLPNTLTLEQWNEIKIKFNNQCAYCGRELPLEQEHVIPVSKGGDYTLNNIIPACRHCNSSKRDKDFQTWYKQQPFYSAEREKAILDFLGYKEDKQQLKLI